MSKPLLTMLDTKLLFLFLFLLNCFAENEFYFVKSLLNDIMTEFNIIWELFQMSSAPLASNIDQADITGSSCSENITKLLFLSLSHYIALQNNSST